MPETYERNGAVVPTGRAGVPDKKTVSDFHSGGQEQVDVKAMSEVAPGDFDAALAEAKEEGNVSRANVVRKIKDIKDGGPETRKQRADKIAELAGSR